MPPVERTKGSSPYWRSLDELADTPEFRRSVEREFLELLPEGLSAATRRRFLKLMGASLALGAAGCGNIDPSWPRYRKAKILPAAYRPPGHDPGRPFHFATSLEIGGVAKPVLAKSYDGRPIKIEGNPEHPASLGAADALAQASVLELYDPDRSIGPCRHDGDRETESSWEVFLEEISPRLAQLADRQGEGLAILTEASSSPTLLDRRARFAERFPAARWYEWEPLTRDAGREGARLVFAQPVRTHYRLEAADVIVALDDDFLMTHPNAVAHARAFAARRNADGEMSRLHVVESAYSVTGSQADHRHPLPSGRIPQAAWALAAELVLRKGVALPSELGYLRAKLEQAHGSTEHLSFVAELAEDLAAHRGHGLVTCGPTQPPGVHALVHVLNAALGNTGTTVTYTPEPDADRPSHVDALRDLVDALGRNRVDTVLILGGNPVHDAPADLDFATALARAKESVHLSLHRNETSAACTWHLPRAHYLEAFSDGRSWDGTVTLAQPLIRPFYGGRTPAELLALLADGTAPADAQELVRAAFDQRFPGGEDAWNRALRDGFVAGSAWSEIRPGFGRATWDPRASDFEWAEPGESVEVAFRQDLSVHDGRFANNAWLQELPDPLTKLTWDNAALVNPITARERGIGQGDVVRLARDGRTLELPVLLMPGQVRGSVTVVLGYGRRQGGGVAVPDSDGHGGGFDVYPLRVSGALWTLPGVEMTRTGKRYPLSTTQNHHAIFNEQQGKGEAHRLPEIYREATLGEYREHPEFAKHLVHHPPLRSLWEEHSYETGHRWGMTIDLSACIGCGACTVACQAENNIPVVGKSEVSRGREMHWIRVDRYFRGDLDEPRMVHQPVPCQQCENAPCEQVCPVAATVHSREGLNDMVYNRCVGTRYCSNNCPYKVRRFNWFNNTDQKYNRPPLFRMQRNPDVTVRSRGVMEKCTYCVQRIKAVTIPAKNERRPVRDGEIVPACAQTCPTQAIVFGDLNDPASRVRASQEHARSYALLEELNVKPRTRYLARVTNPSGEAAGHAGDHHAEASGVHGSRG